MRECGLAQQQGFVGPRLRLPSRSAKAIQPPLQSMVSRQASLLADAGHSTTSAPVMVEWVKALPKVSTIAALAVPACAADTAPVSEEWPRRGKSRPRPGQGRFDQGESAVVPAHGDFRGGVGSGTASDSAAAVGIGACNATR